MEKYDPKDNQIARHFYSLPRRKFDIGNKQSVWQKIENELRQQRLQQDKTSGFFILFRYGKIPVAAFSMLMLVLLIGGATKASEESLPGEKLYTVKKAAEKVERVLATSEEAKVKINIKHAKKRLEEVKTLVNEKNDTEAVTDTLEEFTKTREQVISAASAAKPELIDDAMQLVTQETEVLAEAQINAKSAEIKEVLEVAISESKATIGKLKQTENSEEQDQVKGASATTTEDEINIPTKARPNKPKPADATLESQIQIHGVQPGETEPDTNPEEPTILDEPSLDF